LGDVYAGKKKKKKRSRKMVWRGEWFFPTKRFTLHQERFKVDKKKKKELKPRKINREKRKNKAETTAKGIEELVKEIREQVLSSVRKIDLQMERGGIWVFRSGGIVGGLHVTLG